MYKENDVYIIAEIGGNHEGKIDNAMYLVQEAIKSGVDAIKLQIYTGESIVNKKYDQDRVNHFNKFALSSSEYHALVKLINENNIDFIASIWSYELLDEFVDYMPFIKVGSGDLTTFQFLKKISKYNKPILLSSGLSKLEDIELSVNYIRKCNSIYLKKNMLGILQCTSMYPIPDNEANLNCIRTLKSSFPDYIIGYSDHTNFTYAAEIAVAMGAEILELHFTSNKYKKNNFRDHLVSFTREEILILKEKIRLIKKLQGSYEKNLTLSELSNNHEKSFKRGLYYSRNLVKGTVLKEDDVTSLRPLNSMPDYKFEVILGKKLVKNVEKLSSIQTNDFTLV
jgi:N-acetylneuraminate synthase/N,N'-diacetyllegionaminate synthase